MVAYNKLDVEKLVVGYCRKPIPSTTSEIVRYLKARVPSFYPKTPTKKVAKKFREDILTPLRDEGFIIEYLPGDNVWLKARALVSYHHKKSTTKPRKLNALYQTNFLYLGRETHPLIKRLPKVDKELNLDLVVFLSRFDKAKMNTWDLINFLLCARDDTSKAKLRLFVYKLPFDYNEVELIEKVLDYGSEFRLEGFPLSGDVNSAMGFLERLSKES
ncbi:MAG: hypothetical protein J7L23_04600 [Candidatus Diapherotrites archaeon]|nr:hypothetical protein [Candidatus Diapherotrites archaeon]